MTILAEPNVKIQAGATDLSGNELRYVADAIRQNWVTMGYYVARFEREFADMYGVKHAIACASGTAALHLILDALGVDYRHEVIVPTLTFIATVNAVRYVRAVPVFVDADPETWCIDPADVIQSITPRTKAILPAHLYGVPGKLDELRDIARRHDLLLVEDAAEALGALSHGTRAGKGGIAGAFSFYGNKTITTGEGGMVVTDDDALADKIRLLRGQGMQPDRRYWHVVTGYNYRMTDLQAALGCAQLERLPEMLVRRREVLALYRRHLAGVELHAPTYPISQHGAWALAVLLPAFADREQVMGALARMGVETRPTFPTIHRMPMYQSSERFPVADDLAARGLVLPCHPKLSDEDVMYIAYQLKKAIYG